MLRTLAVPTLLAFGLMASACGAPQNQSIRASAFTQSAVPTPQLSGTPIPVCERLALEGVVASSTVLDEGVVFEIGAMSAELQDRLRSVAAAEVAAVVDQEARFQGVHATQDDVGNGIFVRFTANDDQTLDELADTLQRGIDRRPAAARRVTILREATHVDMQLPNGGPLITSKTSEAARDAVQKWTDRAPTPVSVDDSPYGVRILVGTRDSDRLDDFRERFIREVFTCEERTTALADDASSTDAP